jgi:hypothetical protein
MPRAFDISLKKNEPLQMDKTGKGVIEFTVSNRLGRKVAAKGTAIPSESAPDSKLSRVDPKAVQFTVNPNGYVDLEPTGTTVISIQIQAKPGATEAEGLVKLRVAAKENPDDLSDDGPAGAYRIPAIAKDDGNRHFPWWILAVIGGVAVAGVVAWVFLGGHSPKPGDPCVNGQCKSGMICTGAADAGVCLLASGAKCGDAKDCATGQCTGGRCTWESRRCDTQPSICSPTEVCVPETHGSFCLLKGKQSCDSDRDCASGFCRSDKTCSNEDGTCTAESDCPSPVATCKSGACRLANSQPCTTDAVCATGFCNPGSHQCADLPPPQACVPPCGANFQCVLVPSTTPGTTTHACRPVFRFTPLDLKTFQEIAKTRRH